MVLHMFLLSSGSVGCVGSCFLIVFRCVMSCLMWAGRGFDGFLMDPLGMWCLSALSMVCVSSVFASWTFCGSGVSCSVLSISCVKAGQFALR